MSLTVDAAALVDLIANPDVKSISENLLGHPMLLQSIPLIGADQAWTKRFFVTGYTIAIPDTGVGSSHPFLAGEIVSEAYFSSNQSGTDPVNDPRAVTRENCFIAL